MMTKKAFEFIVLALLAAMFALFLADMLGHRFLVGRLEDAVRLFPISARRTAAVIITVTVHFGVWVAAALVLMRFSAAPPIMASHTEDSDNLFAALTAKNTKDPSPYYRTLFMVGSVMSVIFLAASVVSKTVTGLFSFGLTAFGIVFAIAALYWL